ncbi:MAG: hypothetical protein ACK6AD_14085 [Cyanobacteriota bacterium]
MESCDPKRHWISAATYRRLFPGRVRLHNHHLFKGKCPLRLVSQGVISGTLPEAAAQAHLHSWNADLAHGHTWSLRCGLFPGLPFAEGLV